MTVRALTNLTYAPRCLQLEIQVRWAGKENKGGGERVGRGVNETKRGDGGTEGMQAIIVDRDQRKN